VAGGDDIPRKRGLGVPHLQRSRQPPAPEGIVNFLALLPGQQAHLDLAAPVEIAAREPGAGGGEVVYLTFVILILCCGLSK